MAKFRYRQLLVNNFASSASSGLQFDDRGRDGEEQITGAADRSRLKAGNDLRQLDQLLHGIALGDALRAEGQVYLAAQRRECAGTPAW